jgi:hypothetical protein
MEKVLGTNVMRFWVTDIPKMEISVVAFDSAQPLSGGVLNDRSKYEVEHYFDNLKNVTFLSIKYIET